MPRYRVKEKGFFDNVLRVPGTPSEIVVTAKPLKPVPRWMEEIKESVAKPKRVKRQGRQKIVADPKPDNPSPDSGELNFKGSVEEL